MKRQIEIPVHNNSIVTSRSLNGSHASNLHIQMSDETKYITELKNKLKEIKIRFDTAPHFYLREDYKELIDLLSSCLIHLYENVPLNFVINEWSEEPLRDLIPSERLVKLAIPTNVSELNNDSGYITIETDPTVPAWAKQPTKPSYTAQEVGALPDNTFIPSKTSELTNDAGFLTLHQDVSNKLDKISDPNKLYGTDSQGDLTGYTAGDGISFENGQITNTRTSASWGNITGTLSNQTDLNTALESKANSSDLATVATTGSYNDLNNKPTITGSNGSIVTIDSTGAWITSSNQTINQIKGKTTVTHNTTDHTITADDASSVNVYSSADLANVAYGDPVSSVPSSTSLLLENVTFVIDKTSDTSTNSFEIAPNKMYMFGTRTALTITLAAPTDNTIVNEYMFQFTSGSTATTLSVPSSIKWIKDPDILANKKYLVSIENSLGIIGEWNNE